MDRNNVQTIKITCLLLFLVSILGGTPLLAGTIKDKLKTPRSTVRTFLTSINAARNNPRMIDLAVNCLDSSGLTKNQKASRLVFQLEAILREGDIDTDRIPEITDEDTYVFPEVLGRRIALKKQPDGTWLFDKETVNQIPDLYNEAQKHIQDKNKEAATLNVSPEFSTPRHTFRTFLTAVRRQDNPKIIRSLDLRDIPVAAREEISIQLAHKLQQVIFRARMIIFQEMPDSNYSDPYIWLSEQEGVIELIRLASGENKGEWRFSRETIRSLDKLFDAYASQPYTAELVSIASNSLKPDLFSAPELWFQEILPKWLKAPVYTGKNWHIKLYEVLGILFLPFMAYVVFQGTTHFLTLVVSLILMQRGLHVAYKSILKRFRPTGRYFSLLGIRSSMLLLGVDTAILSRVLTILNPLIWVMGTWAVCRIIDLVGKVMETYDQDNKNRVEITQMLWPVSALATKIFLGLFALYNLMSLFAWDVSTILTGLGIGGVAFALGAQDSLKNLFGSFTLIADRPFLVGESVKIGEQDVGIVEVVGLRSTRIRTADDTLLIVPNSNLTTMNITNFGRRRFHRYSTTISVIYSTPPERLLAFRNGIVDIIRKQIYTRKEKYEVKINDLHNGSVEILVNVYFEIITKPQELDARDQLILGILGLAEELEIDLAYPTQTLNLSHVNELNVRHLHPVAAETDGDEDRQTEGPGKNSQGLHLVKPDQNVA